MCSFYLVDIFGSFTGIRIKGHHRIQSNLGGFFSMLSFIIAIVTICFYGNMYISKSEVSQVQSILKYWNSQNITIDNKMRFAISTKQLGKINNKEEFWEIKAYYIDFDVKNYNINKTHIESYNCRKEEWTNVGDQFTFLELDKALCFNVEKYELSGNSNTQNFKYIAVEYLLKLDNYDLNSDYNSQLAENIAKNTPVADFYFKEGIFDIKGNSMEPTYYINSLSINITFDDVKDLNIYLSEDELVINEDKLIMSNPKISKAYTVGKSEEKISVRSQSQTNSLAIKILSSKEKSIINISFMTFSEMLARVGGIVQNAVTVFILINYLTNFLSYELNLYNDIFKRLERDNLNSLKYSSFSNIYWNTGNNNINRNSSNKSSNSISRKITSKVKFNSYLRSARNNIEPNNQSNSNIEFNNYIPNNEANQMKKIICNNYVVSSIKTGKIIDDYDPSTKNLNAMIRVESLNRSDVNNINKKNKFVNKNFEISEKLKHPFNSNTNNKEQIKIIESSGCSSVSKDNDRDINQITNSLNDIQDNNKIQDNSRISNKISNNNCSHEIYQTHLKQINSYIQMEEIILKYKNLRISLTDYLSIKYIFKCCKGNVLCKQAYMKKEIFLKVDQYLNDAIDISNFEKTYLELNLMKYLNFSEDQLNVFNNLPLLSSHHLIRNKFNYDNINEDNNKIDLSKLNVKRKNNSCKRGEYGVEDDRLYMLFFTNFSNNIA